jgi:pimeloyl-ACP methyl ester carboxylesterase
VGLTGAGPAGPGVPPVGSVDGPGGPVAPGCSDEPTVLLCAGMAEGAATWDRLVPLLATRVTRLDRPGLGVLPAERRSPTLAGEVARIAAAVEAGPAGPIVLVAHSAAALPVEAYARLAPGRLAGLVLVDPSVVGRWPRPGRRRGELARLVAAGSPALAAGLDRGGLARRLGPWAWRSAVRRLGTGSPDPARRAAATRVYGSGRVLTSVLVEWLAYPSMAADLAALRRRTVPPAVPVVVLTALGDLAGGRARADWRSAHAALARSFPAGRQEVLRDSRHLVQWDEPQTVAAAIADVGGWARPGGANRFHRRQSLDRNS